jgi:hypothetical protein
MVRNRPPELRENPGFSVAQRDGPEPVVIAQPPPTALSPERRRRRIIAYTQKLDTPTATPAARVGLGRKALGEQGRCSEWVRCTSANR